MSSQDAYFPVLDEEEGRTFALSAHTVPEQPSGQGVPRDGREGAHAAEK